MARGALALLRNSTDVQPLIDADHALELSGNVQLAPAPSELQEQRRQKYRAVLEQRRSLLRRNVFRTFFILASAVGVSLLFSLILGVPPSFRPWLGVSSLFCFAWSTLARLAWSGQSYRGDTVFERLDELIFKFLYWLGTFLGTLALV
jgi:hypothetical protein